MRRGHIAALRLLQRQEPTVRPPLRGVIANALRFRCPNCQKGPLFANRINKMLPRCPYCGLSYFRESGYYLGGMIITYIFTSFTLLAVYFFSLLLPNLKMFASLSENMTFLVWTLVAILLTFAYVRPAYSLWLSLDFWVDPWEPEKPRT
jgi:uncharacterized protein (DUF983 family)